ncbi:carboxylating nicotinate-nucleotide diphosphorylase [Ohtaekwangia kribbensis]|uniref:nicotinate-nucleotide diphosphorylase (carboxylating) n=1 Tax=Ohtaekwangia kribbensis TaxID=688913 RepID=A0ABW3KC60_9BACT
MKPYYITEEFLDQFIASAFTEDIGDGDHSSLSCIPPEATNRAQLLIKEDGILAGVELALEIFKRTNPALKVEILINEGRPVKKGDVGFIVSGPSRSILTAERLVLNCMQRMSAIATKTHYLSSLIAGTHAVLLDTRKTTPNFRLLEKWAVLIGGGKNHRIGLYDMIMLKDNHIDMAGGHREAIIRTKDYLRATNRDLQIEVETRNLAEVKEVLSVGGVDTIMLDNMSLEDMKTAVALIAGKYKTEASGGITEETIRNVAECGVDFISVGALTHSVKSLDLSLKALNT